MDVMINLETMSTEPNAAIVAIGAVEFDADSGQLGREFYTAVDLFSCQQAGMHVGALTVGWWMRQRQEAREALFLEAKDIRQALALFSYWLERSDHVNSQGMWGSGVDFDNVILQQAYTQNGMAARWGHRQNRCYRTLCALVPEHKIPFKRVGTHHNALDDAKSQALHAIKIFRHLNGQAL